MNATKRCVECFVKHGKIDDLITLTATQKHPLTKNEVYRSLIPEQEFRYSELDQDEVVRSVQKYRSRLPAKALEALCLGFLEYGDAPTAMSIARLHSTPTQLFEKIVRSVEECCDDIEHIFSVVHLVSKQAYDIYLRECIKHGYYELAVKTAKMHRHRLTNKDYEAMVKINLEYYTELEDAVKAARAAGRKLTKLELNNFILMCMSEGEFRVATRALKLLRRPFTDAELNAFSKS